MGKPWRNFSKLNNELTWLSFMTRLIAPFMRWVSDLDNLLSVAEDPELFSSPFRSSICRFSQTVIRLWPNEYLIELSIFNKENSSALVQRLHFLQRMLVEGQKIINSWILFSQFILQYLGLGQTWQQFWAIITDFF